LLQHQRTNINKPTASPYQARKANLPGPWAARCRTASYICGHRKTVQRSILKSNVNALYLRDAEVALGDDQFPADKQLGDDSNLTAKTADARTYRKNLHARELLLHKMVAR
jgi:hypothetical protein